MADVPLYMNNVNGWEKINTSVNANPKDLSHLLDHNGQLGAKAVRIRALSAEQAMLNGRKQVITAEIQTLLREGNTLLDYIQTGVRQHYGLYSEKLVEFGLQPIRPKARTTKTEPAPTEPAPTEPTPTEPTPTEPTSTKPEPKPEKAAPESTQ